MACRGTALLFYFTFISSSGSDWQKTAWYKTLVLSSHKQLLLTQPNFLAQYECSYFHAHCLYFPLHMHYWHIHLPGIQGCTAGSGTNAPTCATSIHFGTSALIILDPMHIPDQSPISTVLKLIFSFSSVRKFDHEHFVKHIPSYHFITPPITWATMVCYDSVHTFLSGPQPLTSNKLQLPFTQL
jgi:hypothetical protein